MSKTEIILRELQRANPGMRLKKPAGGGGHWKIFMGASLVGIIPVKLAKEGLSKNLISQLRRGGVKI